MLLAVLVLAVYCPLLGMVHGNPLLAALLAAIIPIFTKWLVEWLNNRLKKSTDATPDKDRFQTDEAHAVAVLDHAIDDLPRRQRGRRMLLRWMKRHLGKPDQIDRAELADIKAAAEDD